MATSAASGINSNTTVPAESTANKSLNLEQDAFLKLLVAQLRFQNPMSPMDGKEFLAQTAQFAVVEKLEAMGKAQAELTSWQQALAGEGMVGKQVSGKSSTGLDVAGIVTGLSLTTSGPLLKLADGATLPVSNVDEVGPPPTSTT
jgi:flagellar basal-body rod modification protein FlgD